MQATSDNTMLATAIVVGYEKQEHVLPSNGVGRALLQASRKIAPAADSGKRTHDEMMERQENRLK